MPYLLEHSISLRETRLCIGAFADAVARFLHEHRVEQEVFD